MTERFLAGRRIGISVSDSIDLAQLGLGQEHVQDTLVEVTRYLVVAGATLVYGGDLRRDGFTDLLLEVVARHQGREDTSVKFQNYLAWPVHAAMAFHDLADISGLFAPVGELILLSENGEVMQLEQRARFDKIEVADESWAPALTAMRKLLASSCDARIVAGGATKIFKGSMPGVAEEALLSVEAGKPTFVLGVLGGCALDIALQSSLGSAQVGYSADWPGKEHFHGMKASLNPGLESSEAAALASPIASTDSLVLLLRGLHASFGATAPEAVPSRLQAF